MKAKHQEKIGFKNHKLTVINTYRTNGVTYAEAKCDCGNTKVTRLHHLLKGSVKSCGCAVGENHVKHGYKNTKLYGAWGSMKQRCNNPNHQFYHRYGGRGIKVCTEWENDFVAFKDWSLSNGYDDSLSIDRINNEDGYHPDNCRWIPMSEQGANRSNVKRVKLGNKSYTIKGLMKLYGIDYNEAISLYGKFSGNTKFHVTGIHKEVIKEAFEAGHLVKEIARYYKKSPARITEILRELGIHQGRAKGSRSGKNTLTEPDVIKIRELAVQGMSFRQLERMFNVSDSNIQMIVHRKTWRQI